MLDIMMKKKINILSIHSTGLAFGGDETRLLNQCRLFNKDIFSCIVCAPKVSQGSMASHFEKANIRVIYIKTLVADPKKYITPLQYLIRALDFLFYLSQLIKIVYKEKIDILDGRLIGGAFLGILIKKLTNLPVIVTLYEIDESKTFYKRVSRYFLRYSDAIICDSQAKTDELREWINSSRPAYVLIPSAIELKFSSDASIEELKRNKESAGKIVMGQIARIIPHKGQDLLINAFNNIAKKHIDAELWIIGYIRDAGYYKDLMDLVKSLNLEHKVRFIHYPGYIGNVFKAIDIQVHPTRKDSLPNSILEGMSLGVPLISSSIGGIPEMVTHMETGLLFDIENPDELSHCLDQMLTNANFRQALGRAAKKRFDVHFSPDSLTKKLENVFGKISNQ